VRTKDEWKQKTKRILKVFDVFPNKTKHKEEEEAAEAS